MTNIEKLEKQRAKAWKKVLSARKRYGANLGKYSHIRREYREATLALQIAKFGLEA